MSIFKSSGKLEFGKNKNIKYWYFFNSLIYYMVYMVTHTVLQNFQHISATLLLSHILTVMKFVYDLKVNWN